MENATKAFLIAGAVLIAVLILVFGVGIFKSGSDAGNVQETTHTIQQGIDGKLTTVNSLLYN